MVTSKARTATWEYDTRPSAKVVAKGSDGKRGGHLPAPTLTAQGLAKGRDVIRLVYVNGNQPNARDWVDGRPATTVTSDPRISKPGWHDLAEPGSQHKDAVRVTEQEAAVLQSFPPDYPFQGSRTARFTQIGNAVPPLFASAVLSALLADVLNVEQAA